MREYHRVELSKIERRRLAIELAQILVALKQATIDQDPAPAIFDQVCRSNSSTRSTRQGKLH